MVIHDPLVCLGAGAGWANRWTRLVHMAIWTIMSYYNGLSDMLPRSIIIISPSRVWGILKEAFNARVWLVT